MKIRYFAFVTILTVLVSGCGGGSSSSSHTFNDNIEIPPATAEKIRAASEECSRSESVGFRYIINNRVNGQACTTGCQKFYSMGDYCSALRNDELNDNCGAARRQEMYQRDCQR